MMKRTLFLIFIIVLLTGLTFMNCTRKWANPLYTEAGDPVEPDNSDGDNDSTISSKGTISFNKATYIGTGDTATITVIDTDLSGVSIDISLTSDSDMAGINVTLAEISAGKYRGTIGFSTTISIDYVQILVTDGDMIYAEYDDAKPLGLRTTSAVWLATNGGDTRYEQNATDDGYIHGTATVDTSSTFAYLGGGTFGQYRVLIKFSLPGMTTVTSATLVFFRESKTGTGDVFPVDIFEIISNWNEASLNPADVVSTTFYDDIILHGSIPANNGDGEYRVDITSLVQNWIEM